MSVLLYGKLESFGYNVNGTYWIKTQTILTAPKSHIHLYLCIYKVMQTSAFLLRDPDKLRTSKNSMVCTLCAPSSESSAYFNRLCSFHTLTLLGKKRNKFAHRSHLSPQRTSTYKRVPHFVIM